jgi:apolipoprotein N-acyltransferase
LREWSLQRPTRSVLIKIAVAIGTGCLLRFVVNVTPIWWLAWVAPVPLLLLALRCTQAEARWLVPLAALIATTANFTFFRLVVPLPVAIILVIGQALLWIFVVRVTRKVVIRYQSWWTALAYPVLWVAVDTLLAALWHDGDWGSLAYTQADVLPVLQFASLLGVSGVLFLVTLAPATATLAILYGRNLRRGWIAYAGTAVFVIAAVGFGVLRLRTPVDGKPVTVGLASVDDAIGPRASSQYSANILQQYDRLVGSVAARGAQIVVLPEKIAVLRPPQAQQWQAHLGALAAHYGIWLEAGIGVDDGTRPQNWAWLFMPDGTLSARYEKHKLAPPERRADYRSGTDYAVRVIAGQPFGLAICKDMHFASLGRAYGQLGVAAMLVPAWDFNYLDKWLESRTTVTRGVENGYAVVRAGRESVLTVSDAYGRILAQRDSSPLPGSSLVVTMRLSRQLPTVYTRIGNSLGWLCVLAGIVLLIGTRSSPRPHGEYRK